MHAIELIKKHILSGKSCFTINIGDMTVFNFPYC